MDFTKFAKSNSNITILEHNNNLKKELEVILRNNDFLLKKLSYLTEIPISDLILDIEICIDLHDIGKSHSHWQKCLMNNNLKNVELRHEIVYIFNIIEYLYPNNQFDDINDYIKNDKIHILVAILSHHSKLSDEYSDLINKNIVYLNENHKNLLQKNNLSVFEFLKKILTVTFCQKTWYKIAFYRYMLQLVDKNASMKEVNVVELPYFKKFKLSIDKINFYKPIQDMILNNNSNDNITIVRATTGAGKTLASLLWANKKITEGFADRCIIAMPTIFTTNSLHQNISQYCNNTYIYNSKTFMNNSDQNMFKHIKKLEKSISVVTIDHIISSMSLITEEKQHVLYNLANSCLVVDESDFYDDYIMANLYVLLDFLLSINVHILIMSATLPDSFCNFLKTKLKLKSINLVEDKSDYNRERFTINNIKNDTEFDYKKILNYNTVIIYCNTIRRSQDMYHKLIELGVNKTDIVLYHSAFIQPDKDKIEMQVLDKLGETAHLNNTAKGIVIMTQIGELSINISCDYMISDVCVFDRLIQRAGRLKRFSFQHKDVGIIDIIQPTLNSQNFPIPYGFLDAKNGWIENENLKRTKQLLTVGSYNYYKIIENINKIYDNITIDREAIKNSNKLKEYYKKNFIFNRNNKILDENISNNNIDWSVRNINKGCNLFIGTVPDSFENKYSYLIYTEQNTINVSEYDFKKYKNLIIKGKTLIYKNEEVIDVFYLDKKYYDSKFGIIKM